MINIEKIIGLDQLTGDERAAKIVEMGELLFPGAKHPHLAFKRIIKEGRALDTDQLAKLALFLGKSPCDFFSYEKWKSSTKNGIHFFENGDYKAELDSATWVTKVFHKGSLFAEEVIHSGSITLSDYLKKLEALVDFNESRSYTQRQHNTKQ